VIYHERRVVSSDHADGRRMLPAVRHGAVRGAGVRPRHDAGLPRVAEITHVRMPAVRPEAADWEEPRSERVAAEHPVGRRRRGFRTPPDKAVFHDRSGRRRRRIALVLFGAGTFVALLLTTLVLALTGNSPVNLPGFPDATRNVGRPPAGVTSAPSNGTTPGAALHASGAFTAGSTVSATSLTVTLTPGPGSTPTPSLTHGKQPTQTPSHPDPSKSR
jgi:hypothetical protein